jgi:hypothetical protein
LHRPSEKLTENLSRTRSTICKSQPGLILILIRW